jgi:hypothetical protein
MRAGLAFRIGFDDKSTEIGNKAIYFLGLSLPPRYDIGIKRISRF